MARSNPRIFYGVHSFTPYSRTTGLPFGTVEALGGSSFNLTGELAQLNAGSQKFPIAVEESTISAELAVKPKEYPDFLFELFLGKTPTGSGAEAGGGTSTIANKNGTSSVASTGIATVTVKAGSEADLKFTKYVVKVVSPTTVDVFALSSIDFGSGTPKTFEDDALKITASPLTIATATAVEVPGYGIELTGGAGTIAMTADDTATFEVRPINDKSMEVVIGGASDCFPEFGAICIAQKNGAGEMLELDIFRLKAVGLPISLEEKAFAEPEITASAFYDATENGVFKLRHINSAGDC